MKKLSFIRVLILIASCIIISNASISQCVNCYDCSTIGSYSSAIGTSNIAAGDNSFASGIYSVSHGAQSFAIGYSNTTGLNGQNAFVGGSNSEANASGSFCFGSSSIASGLRSVVFGTECTAQQTNSFSFGTDIDNVVPGSILMGCGASNTMNRLTNEGAEPYSFMIGTLSTKPTFYVSKSPSYDKSGKVGIGNVLSPLAKLHVRSDHGEEAAIFVEPEIWWDGAPASLYLGTQEYAVTAHSDLGLIFQSANNYLFSDGNIGIGTDNPSTRFEVAANQPTSFAATISNNENGKGLLLKAGSNTAYLPVLEVQDFEGISMFTVSHDRIYCYEEFRSSNDIITSERLIAGSPTNLPPGYQLYVEQGILTEKVKVELVSEWSDFVFDDEYKLRSIEDVETYINENKHLPDIPSAEEVKTTGVDLVKMDAKLLQKIEELTLYMIELKKENDALKARIDILEKDNTSSTN